MTHPLLGALLDVACAARSLLRHAGTHRQREQLRDAVADLRASGLHVVAGQSAAGVDIGAAEAPVERALPQESEAAPEPKVEAAEFTAAEPETTADAGEASAEAPAADEQPAA